MWTGSSAGSATVHRSAVGVGMVDADERFARLVREERDGTVNLVTNHTEVAARAIDRPGLDAREAVCRHQLGRIDEPRVLPHLHRGVGPPVVAVPHIARVVQLDVFFEDGPTGLETQFDAPLRPVDQILVSDPDRSAPIGILSDRKIHRRRGHPVVRHGKIELDPERRPRAAISDQRLLDRGVRIEHLASRALVQAAVEMTAQIREHRHAQVFVLQVQAAPAHGLATHRQAVAHGIGIVEPAEREQVERRVWIRGVLSVRRDLNRAPPDMDARLWRGREDADRAPQHNDRERPPRRSHEENCIQTL